MLQTKPAYLILVNLISCTSIKDLPSSEPKTKLGTGGGIVALSNEYTGYKTEPLYTGLAGVDGGEHAVGWSIRYPDAPEGERASII